MTTNVDVVWVVALAYRDDPDVIDSIWTDPRAAQAQARRLDPFDERDPAVFIRPYVVNVPRGHSAPMLRRSS